MDLQFQCSWQIILGCHIHSLYHKYTLKTLNTVLDPTNIVKLHNFILMLLIIIITLLKKLREHLNKILYPNELNIQVKHFFFYEFCNSLRTKSAIIYQIEKKIKSLRAGFKISVKNVKYRLIHLVWISSQHRLQLVSWGSPPSPDHQWAPGMSVVLPGGFRCSSA